MGCKAAKLDSDEGRYYCDISGDQCMYLFPSSKACARDYGEGPDTDIRDQNTPYYENKKGDKKHEN